MYTPLCSRDCSCSNGLIAGASCIALERLQFVLSRVFRYTNFRPGQLDAVLPALHGNDAVVRMATGAGKSLCIFLVPLAHSDVGIGVIISPLNALMDEQVLKLAQLGISAIRACDAALDRIEDVKSGKYRFVMMSPETATSSPWRDIFCCPIIKQHLVLVAVDEAHCICEWGSNFREAFNKIGSLKALSKAPFMALTASAPPAFVKEIVTSLSMRQPAIIEQSLNRPNIFYCVMKKTSLKRDLSGLARALKVKGSLDPLPKMVIYCQTKELSVSLHRLLRINASSAVAVYHASLTEETKKAVYEEFCHPGSQIRCLIATVAFGLGIDIPDIRIVIAYGLPSSAALLYQLLGRAGRGGSTSCGVVYTNSRELSKCTDVALKEYCEGKENCRRKVLLAALGSTQEPSQPCSGVCCDSCPPGELPPELSFFTPLQLERQSRTRPVRVVSKEVGVTLRKRLLRERTVITSSTLGYQMLGQEVILPTKCIEQLCKKARYIKSIDDIRLPGIRTSLLERLYIAIMEELS